MCLGVLLVTCTCMLEDTIRKLAEAIRQTISKLQETLTLDFASISSLTIVKEKLRLLVEQCDTVVVIPVLLDENLCKSLESLVSEVRASTDKSIEIISPLACHQYLAKFLVEMLVYRSENIIKRLIELPIVKATGDINLLFEIETNVDLGKILSSVSSSKDIIVDDIRVLTYIDTKNLRPGTRVYLEEDIERFSFSPGSIVVVASYIKPVERVLMLAEQGIKPSLIIATPPCFTSHDVELKRSVLRLDVPAVVTTGFKGGVHVAGTILNTVLSIR